MQEWELKGPGGCHINIWVHSATAWDYVINVYMASSKNAIRETQDGYREGSVVEGWRERGFYFRRNSRKGSIFPPIN